MNLGRILRLTAAFATVAAAAAVCVVAASVAIYAVAESYLGPAGGAAVVAIVFALIPIAVAWVVTRKATRGLKASAEPAEVSLLERAIGFARERPLVALGAAAAAATVLARNPAIVGAIVSAFFAGTSTPNKK